MCLQALGKVVGGWKTKDAEKNEMLQKVNSENVELRQKLGQQHEVLVRCEQQLSQTSEELSRETQRANQCDQHRQLLVCCLFYI